MRRLGRSLRNQRSLAVAATATALTILAGACGGSSTHHSGSKPTTPSTTAATSAPGPAPTSLLRRSRAVVDNATAVHFTLSSSGVASGATALVSGSGDLVRPDELVGSLLVSEDGVSATVKVVELGGRFYVQLPFTAHYSRTNPHTYGLGDPAQLLSPTVGVSSLLTAMRAPKLEGSIRVDGELLDVIAGTVPGTKVPVLSDLDPSKAVTITADIAPGSYQLRRVQLAGPFTKAGSTTTYDVTITDYDEHVTVRAPQT